MQRKKGPKKRRMPWACVENFVLMVKYQDADKVAQEQGTCKNPVFKRIQTLEEFLGTCLVESWRPCKLSRAGELFLPYAKKMLKLRDESYKVCQENASKRPITMRKKRLRMALRPEMMDPAKETIDHLQKKDFCIFQSVQDEAEFYHLFQNKRTLFSVGYMRIPNRGHEIIGIDRFVPVISKDYPMGSTSENIPFLAIAGMNNLTSEAQELLRTHCGIETTITHFLDNVLAANNSITAGKGIGCIPERLLSPLVIPLLPEEKYLEMPIYLHWKDDKAGTLLKRIS